MGRRVMRWRRLILNSDRPIRVRTSALDLARLFGTSLSTCAGSAESFEIGAD